MHNKTVYPFYVLAVLDEANKIINILPIDNQIVAILSYRHQLIRTHVQTLNAEKDQKSLIAAQKLAEYLLHEVEKISAI